VAETALTWQIDDDVAKSMTWQTRRRGSDDDDEIKICGGGGTRLDRGSMEMKFAEDER